MSGGDRVRRREGIFQRVVEITSSGSFALLLPFVQHYWTAGEPDFSGMAVPPFCGKFDGDRISMNRGGGVYRILAEYPDESGSRARDPAFDCSHLTATVFGGGLV